MHFDLLRPAVEVPTWHQCCSITGMAMRLLGLAFSVFLFSAVQAQEATSTESVEIRCQLKSAPEPNSIAINCNEHQPSHFNLVIQTGDFEGFISSGISARFFGRNEVTLLGGYFPEDVDGNRLWEANLKYEFHPFKEIAWKLKNGEVLKFNPFYFGAGAIYGFSQNLFLVDPPPISEKLLHSNGPSIHF